ncbi:Tetratricopeptide-like helical [Gossypium australe]|uniref:Tetratricopeptide-like helical n=1 Tax=Gossypium australe TaxID=47621 RepID=A0A5B6W413_9ROSI|nr:Tetratricopeptide-like helical [Gossypium australe]
MKAVILRGGSIPVTSPALTASSPKVSLSRQSSFAGLYSACQRTLSSPLISLLSPMDKRKPKGTHPHIRRALSDSDIARSVSRSPVGSRCISAGIPEEECASDGEVDRELRALVTGNGIDRAASFAPVWPEYSIPKEEIDFSGDGLGNGGKHGGNHGDDSFDHKSKISDYYRGMLNLNPADSLLLRNYGRFLHEVEKDTERAEEYYGRAILVSPGDGEVLSLYAKLIWERHRDKSRARSYFDRAMTASPDDCMVLGSYAHFMWETEEDDGDNEEDEMDDIFGISAPLVPVF